MNDKEQIWQGYGDEECKTCKLIKNPYILKLCKSMVMYTELQINAAKQGDLVSAAKYEGLQNDRQAVIRCWPGFQRV